MFGNTAPATSSQGMPSNTEGGDTIGLPSNDKYDKLFNFTKSCGIVVILLNPLLIVISEVQAEITCGNSRKLFRDISNSTNCDKFANAGGNSCKLLRRNNNFTNFVSPQTSIGNTFKAFYVGFPLG